MTTIVLKPVESCRWDCVSLGEVMLRLDPGEERIHTARSFVPGRVAGNTTWRAGSGAVLACAPL